MAVKNFLSESATRLPQLPPKNRRRWHYVSEAQQRVIHWARDPYAMGQTKQFNVRKDNADRTRKFKKQSRHFPVCRSYQIVGI
jgi:hypothetical protein